MPLLQLWCQDDGAGMINIDLPKIADNQTMTEHEYKRWWQRFRGTGFDDERDIHFNPENYEKQGSHSAAFMAANDLYTTSFYSCPIYQMIPYTQNAQNMYACVFDLKKPGKENHLLLHCCEMDHIFHPKKTGYDEVSSQMLKWWTNFAKYHDPNGFEVEDSSPYWPAINPTDP